MNIIKTKQRVIRQRPTYFLRAGGSTFTRLNSGGLSTPFCSVVSRPDREGSNKMSDMDDDMFDDEEYDLVS